MVSAGLRKSLRGAGEIVAAEARKEASQHSTSIPPTIKVRTRAATIAVQAGAPDVPLAVLYEKGNAGGGGSNAGEFRHPVFGHKDKPWVTQKRYPFMRPAEARTMPAVEEIVLKELDGAIDMLARG